MSKKTKISIKSLYKIFGHDPASVLQFAIDGMSKESLLEEHGHILGLRNIDIDMKEGDITVIMGLSGSGKSTLIRHLNRLIEPTSGKILIDDTDVMKMDGIELRKLRQSGMSMVFQKFALLPHRNVLDNAALAPSIRGDSVKHCHEEAMKWIERVGLKGFEYHYPHQLSGGMQQRVGLARALTSNSDVMLMDEAFSALDPLIRTDMQDLLLELQKDLRKTIIFITHDLDEALKIADHLVILKDGYVVQQDEPQHILLYPNDPYIEDFVSDINRARVLRVRSVMTKTNEKGKSKFESDIEEDDTLESVISKSDGETNLLYRVVRNGKMVGKLHMKDLVKSLVPRHASQAGVRSNVAS